jgi:hypothetical protein
MTTAVTAVITAVVGVLGTLFAPARRGGRTRRARAAVREAAGRVHPDEPASRQVHTLLQDALHRLREPVNLFRSQHWTEQERDQIEEARREYRDRYAQAQMVVPERILEASRTLNTVLAGADAELKRLDPGLARDGGSAEQALLDL